MYSSQKKLRVDVITKYFYPVAGGIENNIMQTYTALQKQFNWDVTIHTAADSYTEKNIFASEETINTLRVKRYETNKLGFTPEINWEKTDIIALHNFDVFFLKFLIKAYYLKLTGKKSFALILTPHGGFSPEWSMFSPVSRFVKKFYTQTIGAWLINQVVDGVRAVSEWERGEEIKFITPEKVHMIDNGLENEAYEDIDALASEKIKKDVSKYGKYIIQIGRVYAIKNFDTAIKSLKHIPKEYNLVIVGQLQDEEYKQHILKLIKDLKLKNRVIFAGVLRGIDKYYVIRHAQAMVHMALWESGCNVVREGMSQGLPCIVSNVYGLPGLVKNGINGFTLPVHDDKQVGEKLNWLFDPKNEKQKQKIVHANITFGKGQSWTDVARKMDKLYRTCIRGTKTPKVALNATTQAA